MLIVYKGERRELSVRHVRVGGGGEGGGWQFSWDMFRSKEGVLSVGACSIVTVGTCALVKGRRVLFQLEHVQW